MSATTLRAAQAKKEGQIREIAAKFAKNLGPKIVGRIGRTRLVDVATNIVDYKEQMGWSNTPHDLRRLTEMIHYIPARMGLTLTSARLSQKSETDLRGVLWRILISSFPTLEIKPTH